MLIVFLGGGAGPAVRYLGSTVLMRFLSGPFPWGTLAANVTGSFAIGLAMALFTERLAPHPAWRLLLVTGFLGGYTTFSTFEYKLPRRPLRRRLDRTAQPDRPRRARVPGRVARHGRRRAALARE